MKVPEIEKGKIKDTYSILFNTKWLSPGCFEGQAFLVITLLLIAILELDYFSKLLIHRYERQIFITGNSLKPIVYGSILIHITLTLVQIKSYQKAEKCIDTCLKSLCLSTQLILAYSLIRASLILSKTSTPYSIIIPSLMIIFYSILALYYQSTVCTISEEPFDRLSQLISPFLMILPVYFTFYCNIFTININLAIIACSIFLTGFIIWVTWKIEKNKKVSYPLTQYQLSKRKVLIAFSLLPARYPNYLGIIFMVISWSIFACSFWSLLSPILVGVYLKSRASKLDKCFKETNPYVWKEFNSKVPNQIFPIRRYEQN